MVNLLLILDFIELVKLVDKYKFRKTVVTTNGSFLIKNNFEILDSLLNFNHLNITKAHFDEETYMALIKNGFNILTVKVDDGFVFAVYKNFGEESRTVHLGDEILELVQEFDFNGIIECVSKFEDSLNEEDIAIIDEMIYI